MKNVRILDCTLRDGGRIIDCQFNDKEILEINRRLADAKIDIIEVGFLRDWRNVTYSGNSTFFTDVDQITPFIKNRNSMYVAFVDYGMFDFDSLKLYDGKSIDGIRVGFTKKNYNEELPNIIKCMKKVIDCGYKLFIQGVNSLSYTDRELLELIDIVNEIHPYGFGIVDTYGAMYVDDIQRIYSLVDNNLLKDICIDFHSHNNYQLSFALAQEVIRLSRGTRNIVIDATLNGMGKVAGNLNTELIVDYLVRKRNYNYESDQILDIIDDYIYPYRKKEEWGYSVPALMAGIYQSHPNNVLYLLNKFRIQTKDIKNILSMMPQKMRQKYDYDYIDEVYLEYNSKTCDDYQALSKLAERFLNREILVLAPGNTVKKYKKEINEYIKKQKPIVISINFIASVCDYAFFGNVKRYVNLKAERENKKVIITSNISADRVDDIVVNYYSLIDKKYSYYDNSTMMLLRLLRKLDVKHISIAGFDGFEEKENYIDDTFQNQRHKDEFEKLNEEIVGMLSEYLDTLGRETTVQILTPSKFEEVITRKKYE